MPGKKIIFFFLLSSFFLHALIFLSLSLRIEAKGTPLIYSWLNIIKKSDLFFEPQDFILPQGTSFPSHNTRRQFFALSKPASDIYFRDKNYDVFDTSFTETFSQENKAVYVKPKDTYFYLWDRSASFSPQEKEVVSYNIYVSSYGKALLVYPEKLPVNSYGNLYLQEYIRQASFFLNDRFLWTKLEGVVK